jgi:hypothetical protein
LSFARWRANSRQRLRKGRAPRQFHSELLPVDVADAVRERLQHAATRQEADAVFADAATGPFARARKQGEKADEDPTRTR